MPDAQILVNLYDGTRQPIAANVKWMTRLSDGRPLSQRETQIFSALQGSSKLFPVRFFDNFFDDYTVLVTPDGYNDSGWFPVRVHPTAPATVDILALPKDGELHFANATWPHLAAVRANVAAIIQSGCEDATAAQTNYGTVLESRPKALACFLNIVTALADIQLPSGKSPLDYYWKYRLAIWRRRRRGLACSAGCGFQAGSLLLLCGRGYSARRSKGSRSGLFCGRAESRRFPCRRNREL
jgi:hypothetical protein